MSAVVWNFFTPSMERMENLSPRWILEIYLRNVIVFTLVAGTLHMALYVRRVQQQRYKYNRRWLSTTNRSFLWNNQTRDNVFWCLVSGCGVWSAYEALTLWFYANDWIPSVEWDIGMAVHLRAHGDCVSVVGDSLLWHPPGAAHALGL